MSHCHNCKFEKNLTIEEPCNRCSANYKGFEDMWEENVYKPTINTLDRDIAIKHLLTYTQSEERGKRLIEAEKAKETPNKTEIELYEVCTRDAMKMKEAIQELFLEAEGKLPDLDDEIVALSKDFNFIG